MKLLFLSTWFPHPTDNGSKVRVYYLLRALCKQHEVSLLSFAFDTARPAEATALREMCVDVQTVVDNPFKRSGKFQRTRFLSLDPIVTYPLEEMRRAAQRLLDVHSYDAVIASTEVMATYALQAPRSAARILEEHNSLSRWMYERSKAQSNAIQTLRCWISWRKASLYESRLFRRFDLCTMVSEQDRAASLQMLPGYQGPIEVIPNGVDCERNQPGLTTVNPDSLVFNGALTYPVNYGAMKYFLQDIYPIICTQQPRAALSITGSTESVDLDRLMLPDSVKLTGFVDDIRPIVAGSAVCIVPVQEGGGTRVKILEAMALGTPVVSTTKGAEGLAVQHGEHLLLADDAASFAKCVVSLLQNQDLRLHLASNARRLVEEHYDWQKIGRQFTGKIEDVVKRQAN